MDSETVARIEDWETRPFAGGHAGLRSLEADEFSGAVSAGGTWVFMLNGRIIGISDGTLSLVADADGTAYIAPHPSLPLLFAMQHEDGETQAKYYTDDTPLQEADQMLKESNFTGFIKLSENVLSGDYYIVYYGGRSLSVAFIGNAKRIVTGDEAFDKAADEVGIYEVRSLALEVHDVPEPSQTSSGAAVAATDSDEATTPTDDDATEPNEEKTSPTAAEAGNDTEHDSEDTSPAQPDTRVEDSGQTPSDPPRTSEPQRSQESPGDPDKTASDTARAEESRAQTDPATESSSPQHSPSDTESRQDSPAPPANADADTEVGDEEDPFTEEKAWRKTKTVPALDPEETADGRVEPERESPAATRPADATPADRPNQAATPDQSSSRQPEAREDFDAAQEVQARITELQEALEAKEAEIETLQGRLTSISDERDELEAERDDLRARIEDLEARLDAAETASSPEGSQLDPDTALTSTDLLIRYKSKGEATLEDAMSGSASREEISTNLQLDDHTRFDAATTTIDGQPFDRFLANTIEYQFVEWLVTELIHELRETGNQKGLRELYSAIPDIDRAEFRGTVTTQDDAGDEITREFDIVMRDRMGQPLIVANVNNARDPATDDMMETLINDATTAAEGNDTLGAAFLVTSSFFEPEALEMATGASGGGLFNRESKKSFVKLSRKRGYHLCLAESREDTFHIAVPEL